MRQDLIDVLKKITLEEQELLNGNRTIRKERYTNYGDFVVDSRLLLEKGRLIEIRPHTRFAYFPKHRHNYVEMVFMCAGSTTHIINGSTELVLNEGDLLFLNQNVYHEILPAGEGDIAVNFIILPEFFDRPISMIERENILRDFLISTLAGDAAMNEPYTDGTDGVLYYSDETVTEFCKAANRAGLQIEMHAIGDKAFDQATRCLKAALDDFPRKDHRHGIIHDCLPTEEGIKICSEYNIAMPVQSAFIEWKQEPDEYLESLMGKERCSRLNPIKTFADNGIVVGLGSDAPCTSPDPIVWIDKCVNNPNEKERVSIQQALRMATYNGYFISFDEKERGSLEKGKIADMVILSANPYEIPASEIKDLKVEQLILEGKPYESAQEGVLKAVFRGLGSKNRF